MSDDSESVISTADRAPATQGGINGIVPLARAHAALREALTSVVFEPDTSSELLLVIYKAERAVARCIEQAGIDTDEYIQARLSALLAEVKEAETGAGGDTEPAPPEDGGGPPQQSPG